MADSENQDNAPVSDRHRRAGLLGGGTPLNANAQKHGLLADPALVAARFALGGLAPSMRRIERDARQFRAALEAAVLEIHGSISVLHALNIQTAARWERHAMLCLRWLRESPEKLTAAERLAFSKAVADASAARDKAVDRLKLERSPEDFAAEFYASPFPSLSAAAADSAPPSDSYARPHPQTAPAADAPASEFGGHAGDGQ